MKVKGPIAVKDTSHPFSSYKYSRKILNLEKYGFVEEEYFITDTANVYDFDEDKDQVYIVDEDIEFTTRILVRRPKDGNFSGICYIDILNASNNYDIEDLWRRSYLHILENDHMYIGITSKPSNMLSMKHFDFERYRDLDMPSADPKRIPSVINQKIGSVDGCEEGLVWDMVRKIGVNAKENPKGYCGNLDVRYVYLTGQSQSGMYMNTYINYMHNYYKDNGMKNAYDGYLSLASGGFTRSLRQYEDEKFPMAARPYREEEIDVPVITFNTENDYGLFGAISPVGLVWTKNANTDTNKRRYYDMTGAAHTNAASPLVPNNDEIVKTKCPPRILDKDYEYRLNDLPFDYYINGALVNLHKWVTEGIEPPVIDRIDFENKDENGHHYGGVRSPFIDVPKARYTACYEPGSTNGTMEFFTEKEMEDKYGSFENYLDKFVEYTNDQVKEGILTENDAKRAIEWAKNIKE